MWLQDTSSVCQPKIKKVKIGSINLIQSKKFFNHSLEDAEEHGVRRSIVLEDAGVVVGGEERTSQSITKALVTMEKFVEIDK